MEKSLTTSAGEEPSRGSIRSSERIPPSLRSCEKNTFR